MTKAEIKDKMQVGDWNTLAQALGILPDAARKRFDRNKPDAIAAMTKIIEARETVISQIQNPEDKE